jgi:ABC-type uncharacterized transport system ATPase subunit
MTLDSVTDPLLPGPAGIQLAGLVKNFRGPNGEQIHAVRGVDISIAPGETVALLGPNGAGKSTTVDMMLGLSKPDAGRVTCSAGRPPRPSGTVRWARCSRPAACCATCRCARSWR